MMEFQTNARFELPYTSPKFRSTLYANYRRGFHKRQKTTIAETVQKKAPSTGVQKKTSTVTETVQNKIIDGYRLLPETSKHDKIVPHHY